jgi:hypothetical protein
MTQPLSRDNSQFGTRLLQRTRLKLVKNFTKKFTLLLLLILLAQRNQVIRLQKETLLQMDFQEFILIPRTENG